MEKWPNLVIFDPIIFYLRSHYQSPVKRTKAEVGDEVDHSIEFITQQRQNYCNVNSAIASIFMTKTDSYSARKLLVAIVDFLVKYVAFAVESKRPSTLSTLELHELKQRLYDYKEFIQFRFSNYTNSYNAYPHYPRRNVISHFLYSVIIFIRSSGSP